MEGTMPGVSYGNEIGEHLMVYSKKQAAEKLGISVKTLERKVFDGSISYHTIGKRILFDQTDIDSFWNNCRHPAKKQGGAA